MSIAESIQRIRTSIPTRVKLVAVSKNHPIGAIREAMAAGQYVFGENRVQELVDKQQTLPIPAQWHMIGHLQTNKVKLIAPFISLIHSVDSLKLLGEIDCQAAKHRRTIDCLLQIHISMEDTKFGMNREEAAALLESAHYHHMNNIRICGLMGMATFTDNEAQVREEFRNLCKMFQDFKALYFSGKDYFSELSMGMSGDYRMAIEEGSTMIRVGTDIFGVRAR